MLIQHSRALLYSILALFGSLLASSPASACCPSGGVGEPAPSNGLGQINPPSIDLAPHSPWQVYEFERDGIRYLQINDSAGVVRVAVGRIDTTFWVLPIGADADRVSVQGQALPTGTPTQVYLGPDVEIVLYEEGDHQSWWIGLPASTH
jgi:hypothetical protein